MTITESVRPGLERAFSGPLSKTAGMGENEHGQGWSWEKRYRKEHCLSHVLRKGTVAMLKIMEFRLRRVKQQDPKEKGSFPELGPSYYVFNAGVHGVI